MLSAWLDWWYGSGDEHQYRFYRCRDCRRLVTWKRIRAGGCVCNCTYVRPAYLEFWEKVRLLVMPWTV
jgi:hypothetical protein